MTAPSQSPTAPPTPTLPLDLLAVAPPQLQRAAEAWFGGDKGAGIAAAVHRDAVRSGRFEPERHGAGPRAAATWRRHAALRLPEVVDVVAEPAEHGTIEKRVLRLRDDRTVESVSLPMGRGRHNLCVSTQVGCARACTFCETGRMGLLRNLDAGEIVGQVVAQCARGAAHRPHGIVFQGMGEPLDNLDGLLPALDVLLDARGLGYAQERLTVCTVGHVPGVEALQQKGLKRLGLSLSLNAADDAQRASLMPHSVRYPLRELQRALVAYRQRRNFALGVHWCLLPGINDHADDARRLAAFVQPLGRTLVQVIPYNPGRAPIARAPLEHEVVRFVALLREHGVAVRRRITKGRSVMAACGQLGGRPRGGA